MKEHIHRTDQKNQYGMTLVEIIAALAIIAAVIVGALALFENASSSQRATQLYSEIQGLRTVAQQLYMGVGSYNGLDNADIISARKVPPTLSINGNNLNTIFNGTLTVSPFNGNTQIQIAATNIPPEACTQLLLATNSIWQQVQVTGKAVINAFPVTPAIANGAAQGCQANAVNTITWTTIN